VINQHPFEQVPRLPRKKDPTQIDAVYRRRDDCCDDKSRVGRFPLLPRRHSSGTEPTSDNLGMLWSPTVRLLFLIGVCFGLWMLIVLAVTILAGGPNIQ
jgi:hypothetical protein